ncbi:hypothetical protein FRC02_003929 [Tulasnella sp. 418]|nr:hypothetical protein FRC02_003929 [Tulasnella sp. 418]
MQLKDDPPILGKSCALKSRRSQYWNRDFYQQLRASSHAAPPEPNAGTVNYSSKGSYLGKLPEELWDMILRMITPKDVVTCMYAYTDVYEYLSSGDDRCARLWRYILSSEPALPGCPEHLTPGQYGEFVFGDRCSSCRRRRGNIRTHYAFFMRLCGACYDHKAVTSEWILRNLVQPGENFPYKASVLSDDFIPCPGQVGGGRRYSVNHATIALQRYRNLYQIEPAIKTSGEARKRYVGESQSRVSKLNTIANLAQQYHSKQPKDKYKRSARYKEIIKRLEQQPECWTSRDFPKSHTQWQTWMSRKGNITEKGWIDLYSYLKPVLLEERAKNDQIARKLRRKHLLKDWYETLPRKGDIYYPKTESIFSFEPLRSFSNPNPDVEDEIWIREFGQSIQSDLEDSLRNATGHVVREVQSWYQTYFSYIRHRNNISIDMHLDVAVFGCMKCGEILWFDTFYRHKHFIENYKRLNCGILRPNHTHSGAEDHPGALRFLSHVAILTQELVQSSTLTPKPNLRDLLRMGEVFVCERCDVVDQKPVAFARLLRHFVTEDDCHQQLCSRGGRPYKILTHPEAKEMKNCYSRYLENLSIERSTDPALVKNGYWDDNLQCLRCVARGNQVKSIAEMIQHVENEHGIVINTALLSKEATQAF